MRGHPDSLAAESTDTNGGAASQCEDYSSDGFVDYGGATSDAPNSMPMPFGAKLQGRSAGGRVPASAPVMLGPTFSDMSDIHDTLRLVSEAVKNLQDVIAVSDAVHTHRHVQRFNQAGTQVHLSNCLSSLNAIRQQYQEDCAQTMQGAVLDVPCPAQRPPSQEQGKTLIETWAPMKAAPEVHGGGTGAAPAPGVGEPWTFQSATSRALLGLLAKHSEETHAAVDRIITVNGRAPAGKQRQGGDAMPVQSGMTGQRLTPFGPHAGGAERVAQCEVPARGKALHQKSSGGVPKGAVRGGGPHRGHDGGPPKRGDAGESVPSSLRTHLELLQSKDPECVFSVKNIHRLGLNSPAILEHHFGRWGKVESVLVCHNCVKSQDQNSCRFRPSRLGFVVMQRREDANRILAEGEWQGVNHVHILLARFQAGKGATLESDDMTAPSDPTSEFPPFPGQLKFGAMPVSL